MIGNAKNGTQRRLKTILYWNEFYGRYDTYDFGYGHEAFVEKQCAVSDCFATKVNGEFCSCCCLPPLRQLPENLGKLPVTFTQPGATFLAYHCTVPCLPSSLPLGPEPAAERGQVRRHHHPHPRAAQRLAGEEEREAEARHLFTHKKKYSA